jgi:hypothetical protein
MVNVPVRQRKLKRSVPAVILHVDIRAEFNQQLHELDAVTNDSGVQSAHRRVPRIVASSSRNIIIEANRFLASECSLRKKMCVLVRLSVLVLSEVVCTYIP